MSFNETDEELAILYKEGNKEAFKGLINRYTFPLYNFTAHIVNQNDASDVVQEIFIKTWKSIHKFDEKKASFKTWIFTIARNTAIDFLRKKRNLLFSDIPARQLAGGEKESENENSFAENIPDENLLPDEALQKLEDSEFLNRTLEKLNIKEKEILILYYQEELTFDEIGKILQKSLNTVKSTHRRAIIKLQELLDK
ncbi:MAG: sigma-24 (FecI-like protein), RNA polymerase sigma-70 factor, ECF subfamily [Parcubacteria group bacterium GW2011_GWC1_35_8]|nr:MAG: sigma-24 (FecI-like protein), RNA polymerase sigma-70 factor, ECF subfamily [Parcubacteria group bacterium GW2011_GWC1_35_8]